MSQELLTNSMFYDVLFPPETSALEGDKHQLFLAKVLRYLPLNTAAIRQQTLVIFDFETTGLDGERDRIIEIGGIKVMDGQVVGEFSTLVDPQIPLPSAIVQITGITDDMLKGQPTIDQVLPTFLEFFKDAILVAHNAEFDMGFLKNAAARLGYQLQWPCFCTLKMARLLLPDLESKNLDTLAAHYGLQFEARHRSVGDCKVTSAVLQFLFKNEGQNLQAWQDLDPYKVA